VLVSKHGLSHQAKQMPLLLLWPLMLLLLPLVVAYWLHCVFPSLQCARAC
jgi:hypothetical protein